MRVRARLKGPWALTRHRIGWLVVFLVAVLFLLFLMALFTARTAAAIP